MTTPTISVISPSALTNRVLRQPEVLVATGLSHETIRRLEKKNAFPRRIKISPGGTAVGWLASEIEAWLAARAAARS